jgi:Tol biopolymer transport system component
MDSASQRRHAVSVVGSRWLIVCWCALVHVGAACGPEREADPRDLTLAVRSSEGVELFSENGSRPRSLGPAGQFESPRWTPDGCRVVFPGDSGGVAVHELVDDETRLHAEAYELASLAVSPEGSRIVALHGDYEEEGVAVVDLDSGELRELTPAGSKDRRTRWSADGDRVLFHRVFGTWQEQPTLAMVADTRSSGIERLTAADPEVVESETAWWSLDGAWTPALHNVRK